MSQFLISFSNLDNWLFVAPALLLAVLSGYLSERVGIVNIAINGGMVFGGMFLSLMSYAFVPNANDSAPSWSLAISIPLSVIFASAVGFLFGIAAIKLKANHVIVGTGVNLLGTGINFFVAQNARSLLNDTDLRVRYSFVRTGNSVSIEGIAIFAFAIIFVLLVWYLMNFTKTGLRYRAVGENPNVIDTQGISVYKYQWFGVMASTMVAALAGCCFALSPQIPSFSSGDVSGFGFIAIAIMIISMWRIIPSIVISPLFALAYVLTTGVVGNANNTYLLRTIPFIISLLVMMVFGYLNVGPKNVGKHFDKGLR
ncbi:ABC transporter permease [Mycoplasmoides pneumoniae]